ncbi:hypothetical protein [Winogradskyella sp.]|uniref:hypothetical protein n=1 Tax=Winogradskyella sp. TaxID=1883156 RepID=UPI00262CF684|nr:hypothetical protein [Winogradskyella sp.]
MKKLLLSFLILALLTACDNEPIDSDLTEQSGGGDDGGGDDVGGGSGSESGDLTLSVFELDTDISIEFFGLTLRTITNSDINISDDKIVSSNIVLEVEGTPSETETQTYTRNNEGQIISNISVNTSGVTTNEYLITYTDGRISQITYDYFEDDFDDYVYNFEYADNTITRTEVGSSISTVFTLDGFDRIIKKESFDGGFSIQSETITYNGVGNINSSLGTGELDSDYSYTFDDNTNPLQVVYNDNYLLNFLADEYSDEIGQYIAQFHSTNNWTGISSDEDTFTFDLEYNSVGRITRRDVDYSFGDVFSVSMDEEFNYVN